ncbi:DUF1810 family protein [Sphingomonas sp. MAH-20]|jgi:uncharacterized protein (DUF1810 family)|uniref:DUF1810 family protein n=2 Tax=Sphingomonas TaxID=13687 RepID=A0A6I4IZD6_9SPHN|nr:DUF1810 domain-containing protein [Sphingomonas horti]MBA2920683.1 DUF1810 domain-containing protein [Sphingomonas sp. CGMCC 1.13658]MVO77619.1 DUF1810 family protein [Sphingomonas horti]
MPDSTDPHHLQRFVDAQEWAFADALAELGAGQKRTHWMWFIFPQLAELGRSETARFFGIRSADEAQAYLAHPLLGSRLRQCCVALLRHRSRSAEAIMGSVDALKLKSSMTLFEAIADDRSSFAAVLDAFYLGARDALTLDLLGRAGTPIVS